jgi:hypothetical protein
MSRIVIRLIGGRIVLMLIVHGFFCSSVSLWFFCIVFPQWIVVFFVWCDHCLVRHRAVVVFVVSDGKESGARKAEKDSVSEKG